MGICGIINREVKSLQEAGKILQRPQKYIFCSANFGSTIAIVPQQKLKPFLYSSQEQMATQSLLGFCSSFV